MLVSAAKKASEIVNSAEIVNSMNCEPMILFSVTNLHQIFKNIFKKQVKYNLESLTADFFLFSSANANFIFPEERLGTFPERNTGHMS